MDELRKVARERGLVHANAPFEHILKLNLDSMKRWGRLYEVELLALDKITRPSSFMDDVPMGIKMFLKGKINPLPTVGDVRQMRRMVKAAKRIDESRTLKEHADRGRVRRSGSGDRPGRCLMTRLAYYPGCSLHGTAKEMDSSFRASARMLGVELAEIPGWECCGNTAAHAASRLLATALPANEMAKVSRDMQLDSVVVPCAACYSRFQVAKAELDHDEQLRKETELVVGRAIPTDVRVLNLVDVYYDAVGLDALRAKVTHPLGGMKIAAYYGCLLTRPPKITLAEDPEYPTRMDDVLKALGAEPVAWGYKTDCCGASLALCEQAVVVELTPPRARERPRLRRRGRGLRLPALPGEPGHAPGRHQGQGPVLARHPGLLPQPARRPRRRRAGRRDGLEEAHGGGAGPALKRPAGKMIDQPRHCRKDVVTHDSGESGSHPGS